MLLEQNEELKKEVQNLKQEVNHLKNQPKHDVFGQMSGDEKRLSFHTGLPSLACFLLVLRLATSLGFQKFRSLSAENTLLVILMKLKLGLLNSDLAYRFGISAPYVAMILGSRLAILATVARQAIIWPSKESVRANLPSCFLSAGGDLLRTRVVVDCFEIFTERPKSLAARAKMWSNYKSHSTIKFLIGVSPSGAVTFLSNAWGGRASDKAITSESEVMDLVEPLDVVLADRGFLVRDEMAALNVKVVTPHFTRGKRQMTQQQVQESRRISRVRIHVERVIGRVRKRYRILNGVLPANLLPHIDNIAVICCGFVNFDRGIVN